MSRDCYQCGHLIKPIFIKKNIVEYALYKQWKDSESKLCFTCWNKENKNVRKCAIYTRVSTTEQHPEKQVDLLKTFSSQQNIKVYKIYTDMISGTKSSRPALNDLMFDMRNKKFNCVVIYKLDRLGRSLKHLITICEELHNKHVDLIVTSQNIDTKTASGKLLFNILGSVAEFERELISERTKLGQRNAKNIGKRGKDKKKRRTSGYTQRWINEGKKMGVP